MRTQTTPAIDRLRRDVMNLRRIVRKLARILHTHVRTDLAPDAALPAMTRLVQEVEASL